MPELKPCRKCGNIPKIVETYATLRVVCDCGEKGKLFCGDYYDEGFMIAGYGLDAIEDWNRRNDNV